jgi:yecA family protein
MSHAHGDESILDVAELDGLLTAVLSGPVVVEPDTWLVAIWGGEKISHAGRTIAKWIVSSTSASSI